VSYIGFFPIDLYRGIKLHEMDHGEDEHKGGFVEQFGLSQ